MEVTPSLQDTSRCAHEKERKPVKMKSSIIIITALGKERLSSPFLPC